MRSSEWRQGGPSVLGYRPGWLWWAAVAVVLAVFSAMLINQSLRYARIQRYIGERIELHAKEQGLDPSLVRAVVQAESGGDWRARSAKGAMGLMQVTPIALEDVARLDTELGDVNLYDIDDNLHVGTVYLSHMIARFDDDVTLAVAAYHMGPTSISTGLRKYPDLSAYEMIQKHAGPQTRAYVDKVLRLYERSP